ncbi:hypothetical protein [Erwinia sp. JUb26]|uniref:hypothetical protein n=1 Tax=Erwinia sp. JUb26 TaxID=2485126 RepID=UPI000F4953AD|nr:hypothetical protein [Erwinia sp. JUb26]ROR14944.1 hypothetical protein EC836_101444 [Erwinia sp. JUb26]
MKNDDIKNVSVMLHVNGQTLAIVIPPEMKLSIALFALSAASGDGPAQLVTVPHTSLPPDPRMQQ